MCEGGMYALIRVDPKSKIGIRSNFHSVSLEEKSIVFSGISEYGLEKLAPDKIVRFEVIGMPSKVVFQTKILKTMGAGGVICEFPAALISIERRSAARCTTNHNIMAYMELGLWKPDPDNIDAPPGFFHHRDIYSWIPVLDVSVGGVCLQTHFPSCITAIGDNKEDLNASLILPMQEPLQIPVTFRWQKRIRNRLKGTTNDRYQVDYRVGVEFLSISEEQLVKLKQFIRQLSVSEAI